MSIPQSLDIADCSAHGCYFKIIIRRIHVLVYITINKTVYDIILVFRDDWLLCKLIRFDYMMQTRKIFLVKTIFCFPLHLSDKLQINETFYCCHIWKRYSTYMYARWCFQKQTMHCCTLCRIVLSKSL